MERKLKIGEIVYHRDIYDHRESLKVIDLREGEVELEGDYSGGTHSVLQKQWMPIKGVSRIYDYAYKNECRKAAVCIETLALPISDRNQSPELRTMFELLDMVLRLTSDLYLSGEFE